MTFQRMCLPRKWDEDVSIPLDNDENDDNNDNDSDLEGFIAGFGSTGRTP